jgi:hypothetical protein
MVDSADELLALTQSNQEDWFQSYLKEQFLQSLMNCPVVAMNVQIDDVFDELKENLSDYAHGHEFINSNFVLPERRIELENEGVLTEEEKLNLRQFLANDLISDEIFDDKTTEARWFEIKFGREILGAVFYGTNHPLMDSDFGFLGIFKNHEDVRKVMTGFGEPVDPSNYY